ncbi:hypothetical protein RCL1_004544 [Eukaryota sp. TZLM3-RCL]
MTSTEQWVIIDCASDTLKIVAKGFCHTFPNFVVQVPGGSEPLMTRDLTTFLTSPVPNYIVHSPVQNGYITNFELQEAILRKVLGPDELNIIPSQCRFVVCQSLFNFEFCKKNLVSLFLKEFKAISCSFPAHPFLSLLYFTSLVPTFGMYGKNCIVVDLGYSFTWVAPFIDGRLASDRCRRLDVGGSLMDLFLQYWLVKKGHNLSLPICRKLKEDYCKVSLNFISEVNSIDPLKAVVIVNNQVEEISINSEQIIVPEILFNPLLAGINQQGLHEVVLDCVAGLDKEQRKNLLGNILLVGGSSSFQNLVERLSFEVQSSVDCEISVQIFIPPDPTLRQLSAVQGGAIWNHQDAISVAVSQEEVDRSKWNQYSWKLNLK